MREEQETSYHLLVLTIYTIMSTLLCIVNLISDWNRLAVPIIVMLILCCWVLHFFRVGKGISRLYCYIILSLFCLIYYAFHNGTITDIPVILCLLIIVLSEQKDILLINLVALSYLIMILENIFITHYLWIGVEQITVARVALGIVCLLCAVVVSRYFIRKGQNVQQLLQQTSADLAHAKKENERFLSNISHELRTPINAVNGMSEILLQKQLEADTAAKVQIIQDAGKRLYRQVSDIIQYSELHNGYISVQNEEYEPLSIINDVAAEVFNREQWGKKKLDFAIDVDAALPRVLYGDVTKLKKLFVCILDNSMKFTEIGGGCLYVSQRKENYGINLNIDLYDTGIGMSKEEVEHLYGNVAYQTKAGIERHVGGMGLGIPIVQGMVSALHGFLLIDSKKGIGTHTHISIPQQVKNMDASMHIENTWKYRIICYFNADKYERPEIGNYYLSMVEHIRVSFKMEIYEAASLKELQTAIAQSEFTHIFVAEWEYAMDREFFHEVSKHTHVGIFAFEPFPVPEGCDITILLKPVYILSVVNYLKKTMQQEVEEAEQEPGWELGRRKCTALVVDDDEMNLIVAAGILKNMGIEAETCISGKLAIEKCQEKDYDIIFMDFMMPKLNGTATMKRIRHIRNGYYSQIPIVVLTANAVCGARAEFMNDGFDEFISKPIEIPELKKILRKMLESRL